MTWKQDDSHTTIGFSARHMMFSTVRGRFERSKAEIELNPEHPEQSTARIEIDANSINSNDAKRDGHLRSADFLDVENHPLITFTSKSVKSVGGSKYAITGDLTIRGTTKPVTLEADFHGAGKSPWGATVAGVSVAGTIDRRDWGLVWNVPLEGSGVLVSDSVKLEAELELIEEAAPVPAGAAA